MGMMTSVSNYAALLVLLGHFREKDIVLKFSFCGIPWKSLGKVITMGIPAAASRIYVTIFIMIFNKILLSIGGTMAVAALSVIFNLGSLLGITAAALGRAVVMVTGVLYGEEDRDGIRKIIRLAISYSAKLQIIILLITMMFAHVLCGIYLQDAPVAVDMAAAGLRIYAIGFPLMGWNNIFENYYHATRRLWKANLLLVLESLIMLVFFAQILSKTALGISGVWLSFPAAEIVTVFIPILWNVIKNKNISFSLESLLDFSNGFGNIGDSFEMTVENSAQVTEVSQLARKFCDEHEAKERTSYVISLSVEEMVGNIVEYGFADGKRHIVSVKLFYKNEQFLLRIRMIMKMANDVEYQNALNINNLLIKVNS